MSSTPPAPLPDPAALAHSALHDPDFRRAHAAARSILNQDVDQAVAVQALIAGLVHVDALVRRRAAQALGILGAAAVPAAAALAEALQGDPAWTVREAVVEALAVLHEHGAEVRAVLVHCALHDRAPLVREAAARATAECGLCMPGDIEVALHDPYPKVRRRAVGMLGLFPGGMTAIVSLLRGALEDGHVKVRLAAVEALGMRGPEAVDAIPRLVRCAFEGDSRVRFASAQAVWKLVKEPAAKPLRWLIGNLWHGDPMMALHAGLAQPDLPTKVQEELFAVCGRRQVWRRSLGREVSNAADSAAASWPPTLQAIAGIPSSAEAAWLLGFLCERWLLSDSRAP